MPKEVDQLREDAVSSSNTVSTAHHGLVPPRADAGEAPALSSVPVPETTLSAGGFSSLRGVEAFTGRRLAVPGRERSERHPTVHPRQNNSGPWFSPTTSRCR